MSRMPIILRPPSTSAGSADLIRLRAPIPMFRLRSRWLMSTVHAAIAAALLPMANVMDPCVFILNVNVEAKANEVMYVTMWI